MRLPFVAALVSLAALPGCHSSSAFPDGMHEVARATGELERCFYQHLPPAKTEEKGKVLAPCVQAAEKLVLGRLEALKPPPEQAGCYVDSLDGARRAIASMKDMVVLYRDTSAPTFGALIIAFARTADNGMVALGGGLRACSADPRQ